MLMVHFIQESAIWVTNPDIWDSVLQLNGALLAQLETDVFADFWAAVDNFVASGQAWAFAIGLILGYLFRSFTSYG